MSVYRYQIRNNYTNLTGGTINPMISPATGTQEFTNYLTVYSTKPGQNDTSISKPKDISANFFLKPTFKNLKANLNTNQGLESYFDLKLNGGVLVSSGTTLNPILNYKNITIPFNVQIQPTDYSDDIEEFVQVEKKKSINPIIDIEKVKYVPQNYTPVRINFRFYNKTSNSFSTYGGYLSAGLEDITTINKNSFSRSFFRLYFYDSNDTNTQNLLLTEDINTLEYVYTTGAIAPIFELNRIFWLNNDTLFKDNSVNSRRVYVEARFFNAKTGRVHRFINTPLSVVTPITISDLANNQAWKSVKMLIFNPKTNNGNKHFKVDTTLPAGASLQNEITFTEYILVT